MYSLAAVGTFNVLKHTSISRIAIVTLDPHTTDMYVWQFGKTIAFLHSMIHKGNIPTGSQIDILSRGRYSC